MDTFLSCDWGTSSFRLWLVQIDTLHILAEETAAEGIATTFSHWQETGISDPVQRVDFYLSVIQKYLVRLEKSVKIPLAGLPLLISGMASSTIGILNLPYHPLPFATDGAGLSTKILPATPAFNHEILLISGVQSNTDVMRGEETQLIGCMTDNLAETQEAIFIFPGTHSKHIWVQQNQVTAFKTYMTGEFFDLLSSKSILSASVEKENTPNINLAAFSRGVQAAVNTNLLHAAFLVRTNNLFGILDKAENFNYLSGLLIGTELQDLTKYPNSGLYLFCGNKLKVYYETAFRMLGLADRARVFPAQWVDEAVIRGQLKIYHQLKENA